MRAKNIWTFFKISQHNRHRLYIQVIPIMARIEKFAIAKLCQSTKYVNSKLNTQLAFFCWVKPFGGSFVQYINERENTSDS